MHMVGDDHNMMNMRHVGLAASQPCRAAGSASVLATISVIYIYTHTNRVWNTVTGVKVCVMNAE